MKKRLLGILLSFVLMMVMMPALSMNAYAVDHVIQAGSTYGIDANIYFGDGTELYIQMNDISGKEQYQSFTGRAILTYQKYISNAGQHAFTLVHDGTPYNLCISDADSSEPWGIAVTGGYGSSGENAFTFKVLHEAPVDYRLWVSGVQVTSANQDDVLWDDTINKGKVSYDPNRNILTLDGANITADTERQHKYSAIHHEYGLYNLIIDATKDSTVTGPSYTDPKEKSSYGISSESRVTVRGKLTAAGGDASVSAGVFAPAFVVEDKAEATVRGNSSGVYFNEITDARITVRGKLTAEGGDYGIYFIPDSTGNSVTVNSGAELTVTGGGTGIVLNSDDGYLEIKEGAKVRAACGKDGLYNSAVNGIVKNAVPGLGWTNPEGTEGETYLDIDTQGRRLGDDIKCAVFPDPTPTPTPTPTNVSNTPPAKMKAGKTSITMAWNRIQGADGYDIFFAPCNKNDKKNTCKNVKSISGNNTFKWTNSGLKKGTAYKSYVKAYVIRDGKKTYISTSPVMHAYTGGGNKKFTNAKSVTVKKKKVSLKKGKTYKIKAKVNKLKKGKRLMPKSHAPKLRYLTSDSSVATVNAKGKITAKGSGTCTITVFAHNGVSKNVKVTVK